MMFVPLHAAAEPREASVAEPARRPGASTPGAAQPAGAAQPGSPRPQAARPEAGPQGTVNSEIVHAEVIRRRYLLPFEADIFASRPLYVRVAIEFIGTFLLVSVAAGAGVIDLYAGGNQISRTAAVIAPGALVMALIYALGPLSG